MYAAWITALLFTINPLFDRGMTISLKCGLVKMQPLYAQGTGLLPPASLNPVGLLTVFNNNSWRASESNRGHGIRSATLATHVSSPSPVYVWPSSPSSELSRCSFRHGVLTRQSKSLKVPVFPGCHLACQAYHRQAVRRNKSSSITVLSLACCSLLHIMTALCRSSSFKYRPWI